MLLLYRRPCCLLLILQLIQGPHLPVSAPRRATWHPAVLKRILPAGNLVSTTSSSSVSSSQLCESFNWSLTAIQFPQNQLWIKWGQLTNQPKLSELHPLDSQTRIQDYASSALNFIKLCSQWQGYFKYFVKCWLTTISLQCCSVSMSFTPRWD